MTMYDDVKAFQTKFGQLTPRHPVHITRRKLAERVNFMLEEIAELTEAATLGIVVEAKDDEMQDITFVPQTDGEDQDMAKIADGLVDLAYVVLGTAIQMGLPWQALWEEVHAANMRKVPGAVAGRPGQWLDVTKPEGWKPPDIDGVLAKNGYARQMWASGGNRIFDCFCLDDKKPEEKTVSGGLG